jgi:hypothetical protein
MAQVKNNSIAVKDSLLQSDSIVADSSVHKPNIFSLDSLLKDNKFLNTDTPAAFPIKQKLKNGKEFLFYLLSIVVLFLALFKIFYNKYFNNIFRVFFNTSLRQNQLTDILLQAKLPSLIFNIFFVISGGLYAWLIFNYYQNSVHILPWLPILVLGIIYAGKFIVLKLTGWISGMESATNQYTFVIFLINKIIGIVLIPFIILLAFAPANWFNIISILSFCVIGILFLLRYLRSYGSVQAELKINRFHFLLYIIGMEVLPVLIIYKLIVRSLL